MIQTPRQTSSVGDIIYLIQLLSRNIFTIAVSQAGETPMYEIIFSSLSQLNMFFICSSLLLELCSAICAKSCVFGTLAGAVGAFCVLRFGFCHLFAARGAEGVFCVNFSTAFFAN